MKKHLLLFFGLMIAFHLQAQHCDSINNHMVDGYTLMPEFALQLGDGTILCRAHHFTQYHGVFSNYKAKFYKISRHGGIILDSLTMEDFSFDDILMARIHNEDNPTYDPYCNVLAKVLIDSANCKSDLNLTFFDDDLRFNDTMEVTVPLADTIVNHNCFQVTHCLLDSYNDIIFQYVIPTRGGMHFDRFGLDGTLKHKTIIPLSVIPVNYDSWLYDDELAVHGLRQCSESPLKYNLYGYYGDNVGKLWMWENCFVAYELDSLFNIVNTLTIEPTDPNSYPYIHSCKYVNGMVGLDGGSFLVARNIRWDHEMLSTGIMKYDANGNVLKQTWLDASDVFFDQYGRPQDCYIGIDFQKDGNGYVYYAFQCYFDSVNMITVAKFDEELNLIWERYGMHKNAYLDYYSQTGEVGWARIAYFNELTLLDHGGVAVWGHNEAYSNHNPNYGMWMMVVDDGDTGVNETDPAIRPYLIYPNPVKNHLNVQYSPDVKPVKVEVLDLQGRRLSSQKGSLESIDMQNLPSGTYTINVTLDNGKTYSDKIVKQ